MIGSPSDYQSILQGRRITNILDVQDESEMCKMVHFSLLELDRYGEKEYAVLSEIGDSRYTPKDATISFCVNKEGAELVVQELSRFFRRA